MTALSGDATLAMREATIVTVEDTAIVARFPNARDASKQPATGYFDSAADAITALTVRFGLIGIARRRFKTTAQDLLLPNLSSGVPCFRLTDSEQAVDAIHLTARLEADFETEQTTTELFG